MLRAKEFIFNLGENKRRKAFIYGFFFLYLYFKPLLPENTPVSPFFIGTIGLFPDLISTVITFPKPM